MVWPAECTKQKCKEFKFIIEDTPMAVSKKTISNAPSAKTTPTRSDKAAEVTPLTPSNLKTAFRCYY
jgi:hypothetical protein